MTHVRNPLPQLVPQRVAKAKQRVDAGLWERREELAVTGGPVNSGPIPLAEAKRQRFVAVKAGEHFGPAGGGWQSRWFRVEVPVAKAAERGRRHLCWACEGEATAYLDGEPWAGFDPSHRSHLLPDRACTLWLDLGTYQTGIWCGAGPISSYGLRFDGCSLAVRDELAWDVSWDLDAFIQLIGHLLKEDELSGVGGFGHLAPYESASPLVRRLLHQLDRAVDVYNADGLPAFKQALAALATALPAEAWQPVAALCGHAHIDLVWLWPEVEAERKGVHTFATQLRLMERYPEFRFVQSQPALYRAIERRAPALAKRVQAAISRGQWEAMGGFEAEPDNQLPSGEALARSLVLGQRKLAELTGEISRICWLPDVFGYATCLPQILRLGGVDRFYTTKMTWSAITKFPYNSFVWRGHDGSEVLAHLCPTGYNGDVGLAGGLIDPLRGHRQSGVHAETLLGTGFGDGGGGVSEAMCERARRLGSLTKPGKPGGLAGAPRARWSTAGDFFDRLDKLRPELPVYQGELYLEYHRGTYTTQSEFKRLYRRAETALQAHEAVRVVAGGKPIDEAAWRRVAFAQFHDAIPGSSIGLVYAQLNPELAEIGDAALDAAAHELGGRGAHCTVLNPLPIPRTVAVELPKAHAWAVAGVTLPTQAVAGGSLALLQLPALGSATLAPVSAGRRAAAPLTVSERVLDNGVLRAEFDREGRLIALREDGVDLLLAPGGGLRLYHDHPACFDAWDIDHYTAGSAVAVAAMRLHVVEQGAVRAVLRGESALGRASRVTVDYILEAGSRGLKVEVAVAWAEQHALLKWHVPTRYAGRHARFGTPFGSIERAQQPGTEREEAQWEVPGSRWAAVIDDGGDGLALATEAKFGFSCRDGDLGLSLLRRPVDPDATADLGDHRMRFAIGRHRAQTVGDVLCTAAAADALYAPLVVASGGAASEAPFALAETGSLVPSWALPARDGGFIIRLHEAAGRRGVAILELPPGSCDVALVDFLERPLGKVRKLVGNRWALEYAPYQVLSVRIRRR